MEVKLNQRIFDPLMQYGADVYEVLYLKDSFVRVKDRGTDIILFKALPPKYSTGQNRTKFKTYIK